jgi:hypothetical protein
MEHVAHLPSAQKAVSDRKFGLLFTAIFLALGLWPLFKGQQIWWLGLCVAAAFALPSAFAPGLLKPLRVTWMWLGLQLHRVTSPILLGAVFVLVFMPVGLLWRLSGKDPLDQKFDRQSKTYWITRSDSRISAESLKRQF